MKTNKSIIIKTIKDDILYIKFRKKELENTQKVFSNILSLIDMTKDIKIIMDLRILDPNNLETHGVMINSATFLNSALKQRPNNIFKILLTYKQVDILSKSLCLDGLNIYPDLKLAI